MIERVGGERLLEMLLAGTPDRAVNALAGVFPEDAAEVAQQRETLARLAISCTPVTPSSAARARLLSSGARPRRPKRPVLVVCDMLQDHLEPGRPLEIPRARNIVPALQELLKESRRRAIPVVYICDSHAADDPDYRDWPVHALEGTPGADVWPELAPEPGDHIVKKRTYSAFAGTELGPLLDRMDADEIILTGCATEIQLFATATDALQRGFVVTTPPGCQAGMTFLAEQVALGTLSTMAPFQPRYLRQRDQGDQRA